MRQAGRYLPEYRALKEKHSFLEMVKTPELAVEVTLQPLRRFPLDAAILFSDILVIPEALGQPYHFRDEGGIGMDFALKGAADIDKLAPATAIREKLAYIPEALRRLRNELDGSHALLGFSGSPWTLACYMIQGGGAEGFPRAKAFARDEPVLFEKLMTLLTESVTEHLKAQFEAGADAVQLFDSWAGILGADEYENASMRWIRQITANLGPEANVILFARDAKAPPEKLTAAGTRVIAFDWNTDLARTAAQLPANVAVQGNLNPTLLNGDAESVVREARKLLESMRGRPGHIFNLGHGIQPQASIENVSALLDTITTFQ
jgi:uroporphyrinogen decarboxylase